MGIVIVSLRKKGDIMSENTKKTNTSVARVSQESSILVYQKQLLGELSTAMKPTGVEFSEYGTKCVMNAIGGAISFLKSTGKKIKDIDQTLFRLSLQNIGLTELNYAAHPSEIYFDLRGDVLTIKPQGDGNEKLVRKYGVGLVPNTGLKKPWLVREGDEFTPPSYDGLEVTPPKWTPKGFSNKVILVVYPAQKKDGSVEWLISGREEVAQNLIAQIRQNTLYAFNKKDESGKTIYNQYTHKPLVDTVARDKFYASLEGKSLDDILNDVSLKDYINPTYTSGGSREQMIVRKMKNNALKYYPKEYDNSVISDAATELYEDRDDSLGINREEAIDNDSVVNKVEEEINEPIASEDAPQDFDVNEDGEIIAKEEPKEEVKAEPVKEAVKAEEPSNKWGF